MSNKELVEHLNNLKIIQTDSWDENISEELWDKYFKDKYKTIDSGLFIDKHRWYETSIEVFKINEEGFIGVCSITDCFSEQMSIGDCSHRLKFYEMEEIMQPTYIIKK